MINFTNFGGGYPSTLYWPFVRSPNRNKPDAGLCPIARSAMEDSSSSAQHKFELLMFSFYNLVFHLHSQIYQMVNYVVYYDPHIQLVSFMLFHISNLLKFGVEEHTSINYRLLRLTQDEPKPTHNHLVVVTIDTSISFLS